MNERVRHQILAWATALIVIGSARADLIPYTTDQFTVLAAGRLTTAGDVQIDGRAGSLHDIWLAGNTVVHGDLMSMGNFGAADDVIAYGDVFSNGQVYFGRRAQADNVMATGTLYLADDGQYNSVFSGATASLGSGIEIAGDFGGVGYMSVGNSVHISGDLYAGNGYWIPSSSTLDGSVFETAPSVDQWSLTALTEPLFSSGGSDASFAAGSIATLDPGTYMGLSVGQDAVLTLTAGTYEFSTGYFANNTRLLLDNSAGEINISFAGQLNSGSGLQVELANEAGPAAHLRSGGKMYFGSGSLLAGNLEAYDNATLGPNVELTGSLYSSGDIYFDQGASVAKPVPEPASLALLMLGGVLLMVIHTARRPRGA